MIALALCVALLVVGCHLFATTKSLSEQVTLKLSGWGASPVEQQLLNQVLRDFEVSHPKIKVRFEVIADQYMDVIKTRLIGDAAPDVFYLEAVEAPFLMAQNVLEPLDDYINPSFDLADFAPNALKPFTDQNHIYGLPKDYSTLALFYNRKAFAEAGLNRPPQTWDELISDAQRLTVDKDGDRKPDQYGWGILPELPRLVFMPEAFGGQVIDAAGYANFASEPALRGLQIPIRQYQSGTGARPLDVGTNTSSEMFGQGKAAMVMEGNWAIPYLQENFPDLDFATAEIPQINNQPGTAVFTVAYVINRQSQHKQAAWELIAYLTGKTGMAKWTGKGFALPTRKSVSDRLQFERDPLRAPLVAGLNYATPWQVGKYPAPILNNFNNQYISALLGEQPLSQAMQSAQESANQQIRFAETPPQP
jgi:multiple sugar transport system substrate-binding protein